MTRPLSPIATVRKECGLTQREMARRLCLCLRTYQHLEAGGGEYGLVAACAAIFSAHLGRPVSAQWTLHGVPDPHLAPPPIARDTARSDWLSGCGDGKALRVVPRGAPATTRGGRGIESGS